MDIEQIKEFVPHVKIKNVKNVDQVLIYVRFVTLLIYFLMEFVYQFVLTDITEMKQEKNVKNVLNLALNVLERKHVQNVLKDFLYRKMSV